MSVGGVFWEIDTSLRRKWAHSTLRSQYERTGVVDLHNWIEYRPTISRHYDRIMIVIQWGTKGANSDSHPSQTISNHVYIVTFEIVDHTWPPLQLWSRDDKSRFPFDHRIERLRDRRTDNRRGKPRALVIYI